MRPTEFTDEQIIEAGITLQAEGRTVTGFAIRQRIGGGAPNRLKAVWDNYQAQQAAMSIEPAAELPVDVEEKLGLFNKELTDKLMGMAIELNDKAVKAAERRVKDVVAAATEQRAQAERELSDASDTVNDLEEQIDHRDNEITKLTESLDISRQLTQTQAVEIAQHKERLSAAISNAQAEAQRFTSQIDKLHSSNTELNQLNEQLQNELETARNDVAALTATLNQITNELNETKTWLSQERQEKIESRERLAILGEQLKGMTKKPARATPSIRRPITTKK